MLLFQCHKLLPLQPFLFFATGCRTEEHGPILKELFHTEYFKINVVKDADTVELCGSLKVSLSFSFKEILLLPRNNGTVG